MRFLLYRILGNDLPPRHAVGQTLANLDFVLAHEPALPECEKRWVLNRIADPETEARAMEMIARAGHATLRIPFSLDDYAELPVAFDATAERNFLHSPQFLRLPEVNRAIQLEACLRRRIGYAINVNGARNAALAEGRKTAEWILPWDGNVFVTAAGWEGVRAAAAVDACHVVVPMARIDDNARLRDGRLPDAADEEPQLAFHRGSRETFDERLRYGFSDKAALLARLGVAGPWVPGEQARVVAQSRGRSSEAGRHRWGGRVVRLASGNPAAEVDSRRRLHARVAAAIAFARSLDARVIGRGRGPGTALFYRDLPSRPPGWVVPALRAETAPMRAVVAVGVAAAVTADPRLRDLAAARVRASLLSPDPGRPRAAALVQAAIGAFVLDAVLVLRARNLLDEAEVEMLRGRARGMLGWLDSAPMGRAALTSRTGEGTWFEVLVLGLAAFVEDGGAMCAVLERLPMRIAQQIGPDGAQADEERRDRPLHRALANLEGWACLGHMARPLGRDPWACVIAGDRPLRAALRRVRRAAARDGVAATDRARVAAVALLAGEPSDGPAPGPAPLAGSLLPPLWQAVLEPPR